MYILTAELIYLSCTTIKSQYFTRSCICPWLYNTSNEGNEGVSDNLWCVICQSPEVCMPAHSDSGKQVLFLKNKN